MAIGEDLNKTDLKTESLVIFRKLPFCGQE